MPNKNFYTFYFTLNYCNYSGYYTIIKKKPIKSDDDYYVENWKLSLPKSKSIEKTISLFLLDTNVYYESSEIPIVYSETFSSIEECKNQIQNIDKKYRDLDISWSINKEIDIDSDIIYIVFDNKGQILDEGVL